MLNQTLLALALLAIVLTLAAFASSASTGILVAIFVKPFIDSAWNTLVIGSQINPGRLFGVLAPILFLGAILGKKRLTNIPCLGIWTVYVGYAFVTSMFMLINKGPIDAAQSLFRTLNGFAGFLMIQIFFYQKADFRKLLLVLIATGIFPIGVGVYQAATGVVWNYDAALGLVRYSGFFHDIASLRQYILQTFIGLLLFWSYFRPKTGRAFKRLLSLALLCLGALVLFNTYSKAAILIVVAWMLIWAWGRRSFTPVAAIAVITLVLNVIYSDRIWEETELLFSREMAAMDEDTSASDARALAGRVSLWENYWQDYLDRPALGQVFGDGNFRAAHNDYLASLLAGGIVGLAIYVMLLWSMGSRVIKLYWRERSPLNVVALMLFAMWIIDTIGLTPRLYPSYQWFVWGIIGLAMKGIDWGRPPEKAAAPAATSEAVEGDGEETEEEPSPPWPSGGRSRPAPRL